MPYNPHLGPLDEFIKANTKLVHKVARRFMSVALTQGIEYEDIAQEGFIGLIKAYGRFDHTKGFRISTFAVPYIWGSIRNMIVDSGAVEAPRAVRDTARLIHKYGLEDKSAADVAEMFGCRVKHAEHALTYQRQQVVSADHAISTDANSTSLKEMLPDYDDHTTLHVEEFLSKLTEKQASITRMKMIGKTQIEIAGVMGVSQMQISKAVAKIGRRYLKVM